MNSTNRLELQGMSCQHCVRRVRDTLESLDGVDVESVEIGSAAIRIDPDTIAMEKVEEALRDAGYAPR